MDSTSIAKAILALTLVITLQGLVQAQDSLCPLEPVVIHLSRGQKVTISYHVNQGIEQDVVQVPKVTRRPFGPSRISSTTIQSPLVTTGLDPHEDNATDVIKPSTPDVKDGSNATQTETPTDDISTTFESRNETELTTQPSVESTQTVEYSDVASNETVARNETVVEAVNSTILISSETTQATTVGDVDELTTIEVKSQTVTDNVLSTTESANDNSTEIQTENSTLERVDLTTEIDISTSEIITSQTSNDSDVNVNDTTLDEDKAEEVTDESPVNDEPINEIEDDDDDDFGGEIVDEFENENATTQFITSENAEITSTLTSVKENQTSVDEPQLVSNETRELDFNITTFKTTDEVTSIATENETSFTSTNSTNENILSSITVSQTTENSDLPFLPTDEFVNSLLKNLTTLTQREIIEINETDNKTSTIFNLIEESLNLTTTSETPVNQDLNYDEIFINSTDLNATTTTSDDEFENENNNDEEESLLQPILQILINNITDEDSRYAREFESSNSTTSADIDIADEAQYDEEIDEEEDEGEEEVAHADDMHSNSDVEPGREADSVNHNSENVRSERWRRSPRYHVQPNITLCEWHFKTDPGVPLLLSFKNYSTAVSERCEEHHIAVRRSNGYVARWCGKAKESPSHTTFARQELHLLLYSENGPLDTGFVAEIQALDTFLLRKAVNKVRPLYSAHH